MPNGEKKNYVAVKNDSQLAADGEDKSDQILEATSSVKGGDSKKC